MSLIGTAKCITAAVLRFVADELDGDDEDQGDEPAFKIGFGLPMSIEAGEKSS